jgi:hypothetical protein
MYFKTLFAKNRLTVDVDSAREQKKLKARKLPAEA